MTINKSAGLPALSRGAHNHANKSVGHMYPWVDATWNPIQGLCPHRCTYCYMHRFWGLHGAKKQVLKEGYLQDDLGSGMRYFVGSATDMWLADQGWIHQVLDHCRTYAGNAYLFQSKNPAQMIGYDFPPDTTLGTTVETDDRELGQRLSRAPYPAARITALDFLRRFTNAKIMVSIEPVVEFSLPRLVDLIRQCYPDFVSIGADSGRKKLPEPSPKKIMFLIGALRQFTEVRIKPNLRRLLPEDDTRGERSIP